MKNPSLAMEEHGLSLQEYCQQISQKMNENPNGVPLPDFCIEPDDFYGCVDCALEFGIRSCLKCKYFKGKFKYCWPNSIVILTFGYIYLYRFIQISNKCLGGKTPQKE